MKSDLKTSAMLNNNTGSKEYRLQIYNCLISIIFLLSVLKLPVLDRLIYKLISGDGNRIKNNLDKKNNNILHDVNTSDKKRKKQKHHHSAHHKLISQKICRGRPLKVCHNSKKKQENTTNNNDGAFVIASQPEVKSVLYQRLLSDSFHDLTNTNTFPKILEQYQYKKQSSFMDYLNSDETCNADQYNSKSSKFAMSQNRE